MDTLLSLRVFLRIAEDGSLTAAARHLSLSRALVSKHLKNLENRIGTRLANRTTRRLSLTEAGRSFYDRCVQAVADIDEAMHCAGDSTARPQGTLRVTAAHGFGRLYLAPALGDYLTRHPEVKVDLSLNDRVVDIIEEGFDLAIRIGQLEQSTLVARRLASTHLVLCGSPAYLRQQGVPKEPRELARHSCLTYAYAAEPAVWSFRQGTQTIRVRVEGCLQANDGETLMQAALAGHGLIVLPTFLAGDALRQGRLVPLLRDWESEPLGIYAVYPSRRHLSAKVRSFVDFLVARFQGVPAWEAWRQMAPPGA